MTSYTSPDGTIPLVFESGVINLDENGILHIHLSHDKENPHPLLTHPEGEETTIPADASEVHLVGSEGEKISLRCGINETVTLPMGFVFHIQGWKLLQIEMSGDLTIVMAGMEAMPDWFQPGKVHRFDGPDEGVRLYQGSLPLIESREPQQTKKIERQATPPPIIESSPSHDKSEDKSSSGCGLLVVLIAMTAFATTTMAPFFT